MTTSVTFAPVSNFSVGSAPSSITWGDFNNDDNLDLAVANSDSANISVLFGDGNGGFSSTASFSVGGSPNSVQVGDFNKDENLDLVTANGTNVVVLLGNGSGSFNPLSPFVVGTAPQYVTVADFDNDQDLDLVANIFSSVNDYIGVLLGNGTGGFSFPIFPITYYHRFSPGAKANALTAGKFNDDSFSDVAVATKGGTVELLQGNSNGSFTFITTFAVGSNPESVTVGDFNGDGKDDIVTANFDNNTVSVLLGNGSFSFSTAVTFAVGSKPESVTVGDFNDDGEDDIATANSDDNTVSILLGDGSGSFSSAISFSVGSQPKSVTVADFNGDGKDDIATANGNGTVSVLLNQTTQPSTGGGGSGSGGGGGSVGDGNFTNSNDDIFQIGGDDFTKVKIKIQVKGRSSKQFNELGVFNVDDNEGKIEGILPGATGYQEKALARSKTIFSVLTNNPAGYTPDNLSRILEFDGGTQLRFYLRTSTTIIFSSTTTQQITSSSTGGFSIGWRDGSRGESVFDDLVIDVAQTDDDLPIGIGLQGKSEGEAIDLRDFSSDSLIGGSFTVYREASYNNYVGFYKVTDESGGIDTNGDGVADVLVGQAGYLQAAINSRVTDIGLSVGNQGTANSQGNFTGGGIYVPFLIVNGGINALLDSNTSNDPTVFFTFLGANSDKTQHVRLLGDNTFGFEDIVGGGDKDFNDVIVKVNLTASLA